MKWIIWSSGCIFCGFLLAIIAKFINHPLIIAISGCFIGILEGNLFPFPVKNNNKES